MLVDHSSWEHSTHTHFLVFFICLSLVLLLSSTPPICASLCLFMLLSIVYFIGLLFIFTSLLRFLCVVCVVVSVPTYPKPPTLPCPSSVALISPVGNALCCSLPFSLLLSPHMCLSHFPPLEAGKGCLYLLCLLVLMLP